MTDRIHPTIVVLRKEIRRMEHRIAQIDAIHEQRPVSRLLEMRQEVRELLGKHEGDHVKIGELLTPYVAEEKQLNKTIDAQADMKLYDELFQLQIDRDSLASDLFIYEMRHGKRREPREKETS